MSILTWLVGSKLGRYTAMILMALAGISVILLKTFAAGARKEKLKQIQGQLKNLQAGVKNNENINRMSNDDRAIELRKHWTK